MRARFVLIPGFTRTHAHIRAFGDALANAGAEVRSMHLPGHVALQPLLPTINLETLTDNIRARLESLPADRKTILVGESLGGLIGMALAQRPPAQLAGVIAVDPPLTTLKQQGLQYSYAFTREPPELWDAYGYNVFGLGEPHEERDYRGLLAGAAIPVHVIAGSEAGLPVGAIPSALDGEDRDLIRGAPGVTLHEVGPGASHLLLTDTPLEAVALILKIAGDLDRR